MLKEFLYPFADKITYFNLFQYITFRGAYGAMMAFFISVFLMPLVIKLQRRYKIGEIIREDGPKCHMGKKGTPTMGGVVICFSIAMVLLLWMDIRHWHTWVIFFLLLSFGLLGFIDDYLKIMQTKKTGLRAWTKLIGQLIIGSIIGVALMLFGDEQTSKIYFPFVKDASIDLGWFYVILVILIIISTTNAVNITDGLDGLASGLIILIASGFTVISYVTGRIDFSEYLQIPFVANAGELSILSLSIVGSCIGFLWYNCNPASIMMGDTGSLTLGGLIAIIGIITKHEFLLIIMGGVFVIETLSVIIQVFSFKVFKKRVFKMAPLHHHFELKNWKESKVVVRFWIAGGFFLILGLITLKIR